MKKIIVAILVLFLLNAVLGDHGPSQEGHRYGNRHRWNGRRQHHRSDSDSLSKSDSQFLDWYNNRNGNNNNYNQDSQDLTQVPRDGWNGRYRRRHSHHHRDTSNSESTVKSDSDYVDWYNNRNSNSIDNDNSNSNSINNSNQESSDSSYNWSNGWFYSSSSSFETIEYVSTGVVFVIAFSLVSLLFIITTFSCNGSNRIEREYVPVSQL